MKAVLALAIIYIGAFFVVTQGASQNPVQAAPQGASQDASSAKSIDPSKEADIRSLMELVGAHDLIQDAASNSVEQAREKLLATVPNNDKGQTFVNAWAASYQKKFNADDVQEQLVGIYDKHFTDEEIKGLLQFYGSPLGQKVAAEMPKITREIQAASRGASTKAARESLAELKAQNPDVGQSARLAGNGAGNGQRRWQRRNQQDQTQQSAQQQDPQ